MSLLEVFRTLMIPFATHPSHRPSLWCNAFLQQYMWFKEEKFSCQSQTGSSLTIGLYTWLIPPCLLCLLFQTSNHHRCVGQDGRTFDSGVTVEYCKVQRSQSCIRQIAYAHQSVSHGSVHVLHLHGVREKTRFALSCRRTVPAMSNAKVLTTKRLLQSNQQYAATKAKLTGEIFVFGDFSPAVVVFDVCMLVRPKCSRVSPFCLRLPLVIHLSMSKIRAATSTRGVRLCGSMLKHCALIVAAMAVDHNTIGCITFWSPCANKSDAMLLTSCRGRCPIDYAPGNHA